MKVTTSHLSKMIWGFFAMIVFISCEDPRPVEPPTQTISYDEAKTLQDTFIATRANILNDTLGFVDTRDFWFSLDSLKKYVKYVEQEAAKQNLENLGVRIYFAAYPENGDYPQAGYSTVFLVPTAASPPGIQRGILPVQQKNQNIQGIEAMNYGQGGVPPNNY